MKLATIVAAALLHGQASFGAPIVSQDPKRARRRLEICDNDDNLVLGSGEELVDLIAGQFTFDDGAGTVLSVRLLNSGNVAFFETAAVGVASDNLWRSLVTETARPDRVLRMQADGNLVVVNNPRGAEEIFYETGTSGNPGAELRIDADNLSLAIVNNLDGNCETIRFFQGADINDPCQAGCVPLEDDLGRYQIATPLVNYNPKNGNPTDANSNSIDFPSVLIAMEHDDVTGVLGTPRYGSIQLRHFTAGCTEEILVGVGTVLGEVIQDPIEPADTSNASGGESVAPEVTGLNNDYNFVLQDGTTLNGVLTIIRYPVEVLTNEAAGITETNTATGESMTRFCTRLELVDGATPPVVRGFRSIDVTLRFSQDNLSDLTIDTVEDNDNEVPVVPTELGDFSVSMYRAEPDDLTTPILVDDAGAIVNQGEQFTIALVPQVDRGGGASDTTEVNIVSVESCVFFIDSLGNAGGTQDPGDIFDEVISDNNAEDNVEGFRCEESVFGNDIAGCVFSVGLSEEFFNVPSSSPDTSLVNGQCIVMLEFEGARRRVQVSLEEDFSLATGVGILVENNFVEESCTAGCFFLFCWIRFIFCFFQSIFFGGSAP